MHTVQPTPDRFRYGTPNQEAKTLSPPRPEAVPEACFGPQMPLEGDGTRALSAAGSGKGARRADHSLGTTKPVRRADATPASQTSSLGNAGSIKLPCLALEAGGPGTRVNHLSSSLPAMASRQADTVELQQLPAPTPISEPVGEGSDTRADSQDLISPPDTAVAAVEKWNSSTTNVLRICATYWAFLVMGANDAAYGVRRPSPSSEQEPTG